MSEREPVLTHLSGGIVLVASADGMTSRVILLSARLLGIAESVYIDICRNFKDFHIRY